MRTSYTLGDLFKQQLLNLLELGRLDDVQDLLDFAQEHDLHTHTSGKDIHSPLGNTRTLIV